MRPVKVPPMLQTLVQVGLSAVEGREFSMLDSCPHCGGEVSGYDRKVRKFVTLIEGGSARDIHVVVRRFRCSRCGAIVPARAPFYPGTRMGSPVVDLCIVLSRSLTPGKTVALMRALGIAVDRGTVRNLRARDSGEIPTTEMFGTVLPQSMVSLLLAAFRNL
ncbi:MAG TPA: hypothetical protein PLN56_01935 [Methanoregulaceae archaeon]|nr:MAG: hypothetical protein IPI71_02495 [Methanolinea sp.]HON81387.1 hypothetical protein [Methanoregulaceae archaeon]HPD09749.1 hypothetical protein [Methanoregulaceae archaeon]HRT14530.1 hypothetical protein [Methanoregulaceae archaeon]HRU30101.1 hypothetical protein [Methanoregulaceae archaeon]